MIHALILAAALAVPPQSIDAPPPAPKLPHLVYVGAAWCGPCRAKGEPEIRALLDCPTHGESWRRKITLRDFDRFREFAAKHGVSAVPCYLLFDEHGEVIGRHCGPMDRRQVAKFYTEGAAHVR